MCLQLRELGASCLLLARQTGTAGVSETGHKNTAPNSG